MESPIGKLKIEENGKAITALHICKDEDDESDTKCESEEVHRICYETSLLQEAKRQLEEYFAGERKEFDLPIFLHGTDFQKKVWNALLTIPYGNTLSYGEVAAQIGNPKASRAVGGANNKNPIMIIVPCHRVIGANGDLTGFACGLSAKEYLLKLENGRIN